MLPGPTCARRDRGSTSSRASSTTSPVRDHAIQQSNQYAGNEDRIRYFLCGVARLTPSSAPTTVPIAAPSQANGETGESTANVKVGPAPAVPKGLSGSFSRTVTQGDIDRTAKEPGRDANALLPTGHWAMQLDKGMLTFDDPSGSGGGEAFSATPGQLKIWGWPQWRLPPERRGEFCEHERPMTYKWRLSAKTLVIAGGGGCADRDALFVGTWRKKN